MIRTMLIGMIVMGFATGGLFFFNCWKKSGDRLFLLFGISFLILCLQQLLLGVLNLTNEALPLPFIVRLLAFALILVAILDKTFRGRSR